MARLKFFSKPLLTALGLLLIVFPVVKNTLRTGFFPVHDDIQAMRLMEMDKCIADGQIPCRWVPDMGYGYGYPQFSYYGPLPYYVMEIFHLSGLGYLNSIKAGLVLLTILSALGMYLLGKSLWGSGGGFVSSILYTYAPYRALDFYVRGDIAELAALAIFPFLFWTVREILTGKKKFVIWFAISIAALFTSHNISTLIFTPILGLWAVFVILTDKAKKNELKERIIYLFFGGLWGILLGAFFVVPAWFEKGYVHVETLLLGYFNYLAHFVSAKQMLFSTYWNYGASEWGIYDELYLGIGQLHWILPAASALILYMLKKRKELMTVLFLTVIGWAAIFLTHERSTFIWNSVPILAYLQFPWRFTIIATFLFSIAGGVLAKVLEGKKQTAFLVITIFFLSLFFYSGYFRPLKWLDISDDDKFSGESWTRQQTISIFDYLPIDAKFPPATKAPDTPVFIQGKGEVIDGAIRSKSQEWEINVEGDEAIVEIPTFYFPVWKVYVDGKETQIDYSNELGLIRFDATGGRHDIKANLTDTPLRKAANAATLVGIALIPIFLVFKKRLIK